MQDRKKIEIREVASEERRAAFRRPQTHAQRLSLSVRTPAGEDLPGLFRDLTIRGAAAVFVINPRQILVGQSVVLSIGSLSRTTRVVATARVVFCMNVSGGRLCGFQFLDPVSLTPQIDSFYARFFNRRRTQRVGMPLDRKTPVHLIHNGHEVACELLEISTDGMQIRAPRAQAKALDGANHVFVRLPLPGQKDEIHGRAAILRRTQLREMMTLGLSFDLLQEGGFAQHRRALQSWIDRRAAEIAKWDQALGTPKPGGNSPRAA